MMLEMKGSVASLIFAAAVIVSPVQAFPLCVTLLGSDVVSLGTQPGCDHSFAPLNLSFADFQVQVVGPKGGPILLTGEIEAPPTNTGFLQFDPQMSVFQHLQFSFGTSDPLGIVGVGFQFSGSATQATIREVVCTSAGVDLGSGVCTSGSALFDQTLSGTGFFPVTGISVQPGVRSWVDLITQDGTIDSFMVAFQVASVPEPWSVGLTATGLAALGFLRRRTRPHIPTILPQKGR